MTPRPLRSPRLRVMALLAAFACWSCESGTGAGNPGSEVRMELRLADADAGWQTDSSLTFTDPQGTVFRILSAQAHVRHLRLDLPDGADCGDLAVTPPVTCDSGRVEAEGPFLADLVGGTSQPDPGRIVLPAGTYSRIDVRLAEADGDAVPASHDLAGKTLILTAEFAWKGRSDRKLDLALEFTEDMRFEADGGLRLQPATGYSLILGLRVDRWLQGAGITECLEDGDLSLDASGNLSISEGQGSGGCSGIENTIKENLKNSGDLRALPREG